MQWSRITIYRSLRSLPSPHRLLPVLQAVERYNNLLPWTLHCQHLITVCLFHPLHIGWPVHVGLSSSAWFTPAAPGRVWYKSVGYLPESHPAVNGRGWEIKAKGSVQIEQKGIGKQACKNGEQAVERTEEEWRRGDKECKKGLNCKGNRSNQCWKRAKGREKERERNSNSVTCN